MSEKQKIESTPLFREEVIAAQNSQWIGAIRLVQPISITIISSVSIAIASLLIAFLFLGEITKKARVTGITVPVSGSITIVAPNAGTLIQSHVREGNAVVSGQALFTISTQRQNSQGEITTLIEHQLKLKQESLASERRLRTSSTREKELALKQKINNLQFESDQVDQEISLAKRRLSLSQQSVDKFQTLQTSGYVSASQTQQKIEEHIDISTRLSNLQRNKIQLRYSQENLQTEIDALATNLATEIAQLDRANAALTQEMVENGNRRSSQVIAPRADTVTAITSQTGQNIGNGQVLATIIPNDERDSGKDNELIEVHLYAPSKTAGFVNSGQEVLIRYNAYPYQKFGLFSGIVTDVSKTPFAPNELPPNIASTILSNAQQYIAGFNGNEAMYRIKVKLKMQTITTYGESNVIKPGMTLEADIVQDKRKIWEWIIEPILAVTKTAVQ